MNVEVTAEDVEVRDTHAVSTGLLGRGVEIGGGATATLTRVHVERARAAGLLALEGSTVTAEHVTVADTLPRDCAAGYCEDYPAGNGVAVQGSTVSLRHFALRGARLCGVQVSGEADLRDGVIEDTTVGACIQVNGFEVGRVTNNVIFRDNGINVDGTYHPPLPPALPPL